MTDLNSFDRGAGSRITPRLVESLYTEAMVLADEARTYFDTASRADRDSLDPFVALFSESASRVLVAVARTEEVRFTDMCTARGMPHQRIGVVDVGGPDAALDVQGQFSVALDELRAAWSATLPAVFADPLAAARS